MCAVRDRTNLQFFPDGSVFSCGMLVESPALSGYVFRDGELTRRPGNTELTLTGGECAGCPMRQRDGDYVPICIYNRLALN
jgi:hypothetical protein